MGLFGLFAQIGAQQIAGEIVSEGFQEAISTMESMIANEGQESIFVNAVLPEFESAMGPIEDGWDDVDIGEYMAFMGEIVEAGNDIMSEAYELAQELLQEDEEGGGEEGDEEGEDGLFE